MVYTPDIPDAPNDPSNDQPLMKANFQSISTVIGINHVDFDDPSGNQGKHKFLQMPVQTNGPATSASEGAVYTKTVSGNIELFYRPQSQAAMGLEYQLTSAFSASGNGMATLPGGLTFIWGTTAGGSGTKSFHTPFTTNVFNLQVTIGDSNPRYGSTTNLTVNGFDWVVDSTASQIRYLAIGN